MTAGRNRPDIDVGGIVAAWRQLRNHTRIGVITSRKQYEGMVKLLDSLMDETGDNEHHALSGLLEVVGALIEQYEEDHVELPSASPQDVLRFLMERHGLRQGDLKNELGSQGVVSEILNGKRAINARQAKALSVRFNVSAAFFL